MQCDVANFVLSLKLIVGDALVTSTVAGGRGGVSQASVGDYAELQQGICRSTLGGVCHAPHAAFRLQVAGIVANKRQTNYSGTESRR